MDDDYREREISGKTVGIDRTLCIGSGNCTNLAPEIFVIDEENIVAFQDETPDIDADRLEEATAICPVDALFLTDEEGNQVVP
jgi:ferredoxin